jgi:hypothetical protein
MTNYFGEFIGSLFWGIFFLYLLLMSFYGVLTIGRDFFHYRYSEPRL